MPDPYRSLATAQAKPEAEPARSRWGRWYLVAYPFWAWPLATWLASASLDRPLARLRIVMSLVSLWASFMLALFALVTWVDRHSPSLSAFLRRHLDKE